MKYFRAQNNQYYQKSQQYFQPKKLILQYSVSGCYIDAYVLEHKLAIEIDEKIHKDRNIDQEIERQKAPEKVLDCKFIRINPEKQNFDVFIEISKI